MNMVARAAVLVCLVTSCLPPHVHTSQPSFFPTQRQNPGQNTRQHVPAIHEGQTAPLPDPALPSSRKFLSFPYSSGSPRHFRGFSKSGFPTPNIPFHHQGFGAGVDSPSPLDYLNQDNFANNNDNGGRRRIHLPPRQSGVDERNLHRTLQHRHPFTSTRLNPVPTSEGVSLSRPQEDPFHRGRGRRLKSLFDTDKARKYSLDAPSSFERPISRNSLPDLHSPIRLDLVAPEELQRVAFVAASRGKLPPSRGLNAIADMERPKLASLFNTRSPTSLPRLHSPPPSSPSTPAPTPSQPSREHVSLNPPKSEPVNLQPDTNAEVSGNKRKPSIEDEVPNVEKEKEQLERTEDLSRSKSFVGLGDVSVSDRNNKTVQSENNIASTTEQPRHLDEPPPINTFMQAKPNKESSSKAEHTDLGNATVTKNAVEKPLLNMEMLSSIKERPGLDDLPPINEIRRPVQDTTLSEAEDDPPPVDELPQYPPKDENPESLDEEDIPTINDLMPVTMSDEFGPVSSSESHQDSNPLSRSVIDHNGIAITFGELRPMTGPENDTEQLVIPHDNIYDSKRTETSKAYEDEPTGNLKERELSHVYKKDTDAEKNSSFEQIQENNDPDSTFTHISKTESPLHHSPVTPRISFSSADSLVNLTHVSGVSDSSPDSPSQPNELQADVEDKHRHSSQLQELKENITEDVHTQPADVTKLSDAKDFHGHETKLSSPSNQDVNKTPGDPNESKNSGESTEEFKETVVRSHSDFIPRGTQDHGIANEFISNSTVDDSQTVTPNYPYLSISSGSPDSDQGTSPSTISERNSDVSTRGFIDSAAASPRTGEWNADISLLSNRNNKNSSRSQSVPEKGEEVANEDKQGERRDRYIVGSKAQPRDVAVGDEAGHDTRGTDYHLSGPSFLQVDIGTTDPNHTTGEHSQAHGDSNHNTLHPEQLSSEDSTPPQQKASRPQPTLTPVDKPGALTTSSKESSSPDLSGDSLLDDSLTATDKATTGEKSPEHSDELDNHNPRELTDFRNEAQQTISVLQDNELQRSNPANTKDASATENMRFQTPSPPADIADPSITENTKFQTPSRIPASPFEKMFGKSLQEAYHQSFGSLFSSLHKPPSQSRVLFGRGGLSMSTGLFGQQPQLGGSAQPSGATNDKSDTRHRQGFNVNSIVKRRPSLRFFANNK